MDTAIKRSVEIFLQWLFLPFCGENVILKPAKAKQKEARFASQTHFDVFQLTPAAPLQLQQPKRSSKPQTCSRFLQLNGILDILDSLPEGEDDSQPTGSRTNTVQLSNSEFLVCSRTTFTTTD